MIAAVVLSAGESSRMGRPKALLPIGDKTFIEAIVSALRETRVEKIVVVLGHNPDEIKSKIVHLPVEVLLNPNYTSGQLSSLIVAIRYLGNEKDIEGVLVHLVDHPFLNPALVNHMIDRFEESKKLIVVPRYRGRRGHPVLFSRRLFAELLETPLDQGAKAVVHAHRDETLEIDAEEEGVIVDIDTPEEYRKYARRQ
ncbi:MAG: nucleotidyltransferase family protein [Deltaproteobacteria bacterium]|nr:nucleotidyltransferase family protein [Deltaproteobacteria bacterium]